MPDSETDYKRMVLNHPRFGKSVITLKFDQYISLTELNDHYNKVEVHSSTPFSEIIPLSIHLFQPASTHC